MSTGYVRMTRRELIRVRAGIRREHDYYQRIARETRIEVSGIDGVVISQTFEQAYLSVRYAFSPQNGKRRQTTNFYAIDEDGRINWRRIIGTVAIEVSA